MRKILPLFMIISFSLSGCNLPFQSTSSVPTVDVLGTQVAQRLTTTASVIQPAATTAGPKPTSAAASSTPAATNMPATVTGTPTLTGEPSATLTITQTLEPNRTSTRTPTPTGIPGDPVTNLGQPDWKDNFQKASTWGLQSPYDDDHTRISITSGKLEVKSLNSDGWRGWRMMSRKIKDFYLQATIQTLTCSGSDLYGLVFRATDNFKGYWLSITCDGHYSLDVGDINKFDPVIPSKSSTLIKSGSNQENRFGIMAQGNKISFYANGKLVEEVTNDAMGSAGNFGYFIAGEKTAGFTIQSTEIAYWVLP